MYLIQVNKHHSKVMLLLVHKLIMDVILLNCKFNNIIIITLVSTHLW